MEGFVDEEVVKRLVAKSPPAVCPQAFRIAPAATALVLSAEEFDYAGLEVRVPPPADEAVRVPLIALLGLTLAPLPSLPQPQQSILPLQSVVSSPVAEPQGEAPPPKEGKIISHATP
jgi:hypothetical protein